MVFPCLLRTVVLCNIGSHLAFKFSHCPGWLVVRLLVIHAVERTGGRLQTCGAPGMGYFPAVGIHCPCSQETNCLRELRASSWLR